MRKEDELIWREIKEIYGRLQALELMITDHVKVLDDIFPSHAKALRQQLERTLSGIGPSPATVEFVEAMEGHIWMMRQIDDVNSSSR